MAKKKGDDTPKVTGTSKTDQNKAARMVKQKKLQAKKAAKAPVKTPKGTARTYRRNHPHSDEALA